MDWKITIRGCPVENRVKFVLKITGFVAAGKQLENIILENKQILLIFCELRRIWTCFSVLNPIFLAQVLRCHVVQYNFLFENY